LLIVAEPVPREETVGLKVAPLQVAVRTLPGVTEDESVGGNRLVPPESHSGDPIRGSDENSTALGGGRPVDFHA
jgi:hypothetical protein